MAGQRTVFNHVGLCVADTARSRRFYEGLLDFAFWWELSPPDEGTGQLLQLNAPIGLHATYLVRDGLVLELLAYSHRPLRAGSDTRDGSGWTHPPVAVGIRPRCGAGTSGRFRRLGCRRQRFGSVGDDSRSGRAAAGAALGLVARRLAAAPELSGLTQPSTHDVPVDLSVTDFPSNSTAALRLNAYALTDNWSGNSVEKEEGMIRTCLPGGECEDHRR